MPTPDVASRPSDASPFSLVTASFYISPSSARHLPSSGPRARWHAICSAAGNSSIPRNLGLWDALA